VFDLIEEPLDQIAVAVEIGAKADRAFAVAVRWGVGQRAAP